MTSMLAAEPRAAGTASAARLLARWWSRPTAGELQEWSALWPQALETATVLGLSPESVERVRGAATSSSEEELLAEYERLLVGPGRPACPPYESLWRSDQGRFERGRLMGPAAADVVQIYRDLGLRVRKDAHELPDHLVIELEALAHACESGATEQASQLLDAHLGLWVPAFCDAVSADTAQPFYAELARLTPAWMAALVG